MSRKLLLLLTRLKTTQITQSANSCVSVVLTFVRALYKHLESNDESDKELAY